jgi:hypothetical protein
MNEKTWVALCNLKKGDLFQWQMEFGPRRSATVDAPPSITGEPPMGPLITVTLADGIGETFFYRTNANCKFWINDAYVAWWRRHLKRRSYVWLFRNLVIPIYVVNVENLTLFFKREQLKCRIVTDIGTTIYRCIPVVTCVIMQRSVDRQQDFHKLRGRLLLHILTRDVW